MIPSLLSKGLLLLQLFSLAAGKNASDSSTPRYKDASAPVEERVTDLLGRMTTEDKMAQLIQGDITNWMDGTTGDFNYTGLVENMETKAGMFYGRLPNISIIGA